MSARHSPRLLRRRTLLTAAPLLAALAACGDNGPEHIDVIPDGPADDPASPLASEVKPRVIDLTEAESLGAAVSACDELGATLLTHALAQAPQANAVVCPVGAGLMLATLYAGAADVPDEVSLLLGFDVTATYREGLPVARDTAWSALMQSLKRHDAEDPAVITGFDPEELPDAPLLHIANRALLVRPEDGDLRGAVTQNYLDDLRRWYQAGAAQASRGQAQESLDTWASWHTGGLVPSSAIEVTEDTRLVLQNAVLLAARWLSPFEATATDEAGEFHRADGTLVTTALMHQTGDFPMVSGQGWRALRMPYAQAEDALVMDLVLPDDVVHPADLPSSTWAEASALLENKHDSPVPVDLTLPRLDLSSGTIDVLTALAGVGVELGDLPHIGDDLRVDQAAQQVRLRVDEEGTVGASLTEADVAVVAAPEPAPDSFVCDHPFVLRVVDRTSGVCVFEAAVVNPTAR